MTAKQLSIFKGAASLEEYSELFTVSLEWFAQEYFLGLILLCNFFCINRLMLE